MIGKHLSSAIVRNVRASRASDCAASSWRARPRCFAPFFAARPASRRGLQTALPLRGVLVLGASPPFLRPAPLRVAGFGLRCLFAACSSSVLRTLFCGPPRFASRASGCAASSRRARPRCFAPFFAARPAVFFSLPLFKQRKTPGAAFPPPGGLLIVAYFFTVFWAMPRMWAMVQPYSLQVTTLPQ